MPKFEPNVFQRAELRVLLSSRSAAHNVAPIEWEKQHSATVEGKTSAPADAKHAEPSSSPSRPNGTNAYSPIPKHPHSAPASSQKAAEMQSPKHTSATATSEEFRPETSFSSSNPPLDRESRILASQKISPHSQTPSPYPNMSAIEASTP